MNTILITGVTGNIGSHVLYELIYNAQQTGVKPEIYAVIRPSKGKTGKQRLLSEVFNPSLVPNKIKGFYKNFIEHIHVIEGEINNFNIPKKAGNQILVYHLAASVNLGITKKAKNEIATINYKSTHAFFDIIKTRTKKLIFVSTAFSRGDVEGVITDDYHSETHFKFRNFYEEFKMKIEKEILQIAHEHHFECTIARPSVVSGRLLDFPKFVTNTYTVFYAIGAFFKKMLDQNNPSEKIRIAVNNNGGLNIVPVDYVAKGIISAATTKAKQVNITHTQNISHQQIIKSIFLKCGITNYEFVANEPTEKSTIEKLFYKTIGNQLAKYSTSKQHFFESKIIRELLNEIAEPNITEVFQQLYDFAHDISFDNKNIEIKSI